MRKLTSLIMIITMIFLVMGITQYASADQCYVQVKIKRGTHIVEVDGEKLRLGPGRYTLDCKCLAPRIYIDGQMIPLYPNQLHGGNVYKIKVR